MKNQVVKTFLLLNIEILQNSEDYFRVPVKKLHNSLFFFVYQKTLHVNLYKNYVVQKYEPLSILFWKQSQRPGINQYDTMAFE